MEFVTVAERPELVEPAWEATADAFPEYNNHGDVLNRYWGRLTEERPDFQFHLLDGGEILARGRSIPIRWDRTLDDLPEGIDGAIARGFDEGGANVLCALLVAVPRTLRRRGTSSAALQAMQELARRQRARVPDRAGAAEPEGPLPAAADRALRGLAAGRRPALRPLAACPRAARRDRTRGPSHVRCGSRARSPSGSSWTEMAFPDDGDYVFAGGLAPVSIDREADRGAYWEPNVWMRHAV